MLGTIAILDGELLDELSWASTFTRLEFTPPLQRPLIEDHVLLDVSPSRIPLWVAATDAAF